jgi:DHA2 family multidrug resistance protein-like MFS transporter
VARDEGAITAAAVAPQDGLDTPRRYWALTGLWTGMAMSVIDSSIANIALPSIARDLAVSPSTTTWVVTAYQIAIVMTLLPVAALGERLGYGRVYLGGLVLFILMSVACAFAPNLEALAAFRFIQGLGASAMMSVNGAQMRHTWPKALLGRGIGYNAVVVSCTAAGGPALAGFILSLGSWHWLFLVNIPVGLAALALVVRFGPRTPSVTRVFDWQDALLNAVMLGALFLAFSDAIHGHFSLWLVLMTAAGLVTGAWLIIRVRTKARPLIPLDLLRIPRMRIAYSASICAFAAQMSMLVTLPFQLESRRGLAAAAIGLIILPLPIAIAATSPFAGRLADRSWAGRMSAIGLVLMAVAMVLMALLIPSGPLPLIAAALGLSGLGFGLFQSPNNNVMLRTGPIDRAGAAAGMQAQCRLIGQTIGALIAALALRLAGMESAAALYVAAGLALCSAMFARAR